MFFKFEVTNKYAINDLGFAFLRIEEFKKYSIKAFKANIEAHPNSYDAYSDLGSAYEKLGELQKAKTNYEKVLELDQNNLNANGYLLILAALYDKDLIEATNIYQKIKILYPNRNLSSLDAVILALEGKREEALKLRQTLQVYSILKMKKEAIDSWSTPSNYTRFYTYLSLQSSLQIQLVSHQLWML